MNPPLAGRRYGPDAWLLAFASDVDHAAFVRGEALRAALESRPPHGLVELVPSFTTLLCRFGPGQAPADPAWWTPWEASMATAPLPGPRTVSIPVRYDGEDLGLVARHHGLRVEDVVRLHASADYVVHCLGFAPGFPYLGGLPEALHTPRRAVPRTRVPAGSVAIGGGHAGIYSIPSPGGWNLVGTTPCRLFMPEASGEDAFLLRPGDRVRFHESDRSPEPGGATAPAETGGVACLTVLSAGTGLTVQDRGRPGWARFGVPRGGAMDPVSLERANRLVDNPPDAAGLELVLGRQELRAEREVVLGFAGAGLGAQRWRAGADHPEPLEPGRTISLGRGDRLRFTGGRHGVWAYLAVPGGVEAAPVMGSRASTPRAGIGVVLGAGARIGNRPGAEFRLPPGTASRRVPWDGARDEVDGVRVRVWPGPQAEAFDAGAVREWLAATWRVSPESDRVGFRLDGPRLSPPGRELVSEPVLPGTVQVPPGGQPIVTMADGPTMGGYAKLALVDPADLPRVAQSAPGTPVRFVPLDVPGWPGPVREFLP